MQVNLAHSVLLEGFVVFFPPLKTVGLSLGFWKSLCSVYSLLSARASLKEVGMETIFYFGYWIISGVSCTKIFKCADVHCGVVEFYKKATKRGRN